MIWIKRIIFIIFIILTLTLILLATRYLINERKNTKIDEFIRSIKLSEQEDNYCEKLLLGLGDMFPNTAFALDQENNKCVIDYVDFTPITMKPFGQRYTVTVNDNHTSVLHEKLGNAQ